MKEIIIKENDSGQRLDRFLMKTFPQLPQSLLYKAIRNKKIKVNCARCTINQRLCPDDSVLLFLPPQFLEEKTADYDFLQVPCALDIVYEDENILILDKPVGLRSQSDSAGIQDCVVLRLLHYLYKKQEYDPEHEQSFVPALCNRLDRNTRGLIIAGKKAAALREVNAAIRSGNVHKYYLAMVKGKLVPAHDHVELYHRKEGTKALISSRQEKGMKPCSLRYDVIHQYSKQALTEIELFSGKFHQIRAMFSYLHHPLVNDAKYGEEKKAGQQALAAYRLCFSLDADSPLAYLNEKKIALNKDDVLSQWKKQGILS